MAMSRARSSKHGGAAAKTGFSSSRHESAMSCMPSTATVSSEFLPDLREFPCFPYDAQAKCRLQEHVAGPQMCRSPPLYALLNLGSQARDEACFFVKLEIVDVGVWYGRGGSKKIAESSAAIAGLIDTGIDTLHQHFGRPAGEIVTIAPVVSECTRQHPYDDRAKCRLQEFVVGRTMRLPAPLYTVHSISGPKNNQCFIVKMDIQKCGTWFGSGTNKKHAECSAAVSALADLRVDPPLQHRRERDNQVDVASVREEL
jgi:dsRNA-specific ribonuclease